MGITTVVSNLNIVMNMALCVWLSYYEANEINPHSQFEWNKVGAVWFSIPIVPWYDNDHTFAMGGICSTPYYDYISKAKKAASDIAIGGVGKIGYYKIIGRNLTYDEAEDRLMKMVYWGDGYYVSSKTITVYGGPKSDAVNGKTIDITDPFDRIEISIA